MAFWNRESPEQKQARLAAEQVQRDSMAELAQGRLPLKAVARLQELSQKSDFFTSDLTSNEHLLTRHAGYHPISQVMGSCFYKVSFRGYSWTGSRTTGELSALTQAQLSARDLAVSRLKQEAALLGADGVIGVRLKVGEYDWSSGLIEFTAVGTAIRLATGRSGREVFTSTFSGQDFWKLAQRGYWPRDIAYGVCSYYIHSDQQTRSLLNSFWGSLQANQEIPQFTQGFARSRHLAMERFAGQVKSHDAHSAVGVDVTWDAEEVEYEVNDRTYKDLLVTFTAVGTSLSDSPVPAKKAGTLTFMNLKE